MICIKKRRKKYTKYNKSKKRLYEIAYDVVFRLSHLLLIPRLLIQPTFKSRKKGTKQPEYSWFYIHPYDMTFGKHFIFHFRYVFYYSFFLQLSAILRGEALLKDMFVTSNSFYMKT